MRNYQRRSSFSSWLTSLAWPWVAFATFAVVSVVWWVLPSLHLPGWQTNIFVRVLDTGLRLPFFYRFLGWALLVAGSMATLAAWRNGAHRKRLLAKVAAIEHLKNMSWRDFEVLVGQYYRRSGYSVTETGQGGADGGIDLILLRGQQKIIVQCKRWRNVNVGAPVIREMYGLIQHHWADGAVIVTCGNFSFDAKAFAHGKPIELINGQTLLKMVTDINGAR